MPSPREIALTQNNKGSFDPEPNDDEQNPKTKEPDYGGRPEAAPPEEKAPFK